MDLNTWRGLSGDERKKRREDSEDAATSAVSAHVALHVHDVTLMVREEHPTAKILVVQLYESDGWKVDLIAVLDGEENALFEDGKLEVGTPDGTYAKGDGWPMIERITDVLDPIGDWLAIEIGDPHADAHINLG